MIVSDKVYSGEYIRFDEIEAILCVGFHERIVHCSYVGGWFTMD
jgi:hypothetical protein